MQNILQLDDCKLSQIGTLPFIHNNGAGVSLGGLIILCFNMLASSPDYKLCRSATSATGGTWTEMELSTYEHDQASMSPSTGGSSKNIKNIKNPFRQLFSHSKKIWTH